MAWRLLAAAGNHLIDKIEDLRFGDCDWWETGDKASIELFGRLGVPKAKEFLQEVMLELDFLGTKWKVGSAHASIDTKPFDADKIPRLAEVENEDVDMEEVNTEDVEMEDVNEEIAKKEVIETEIVSPSSLHDFTFSNIQRKSTSRLPFPILNTSPAPTRHKATNLFNPPTAPHPAAHISSIDFATDNDAYASTHPMFLFPTPTSVQKDIPPPEIIPQPVTAMESERMLAAEQEYIASVKRVGAYVGSVVYLMRPLPGAIHG